jgi:hypothetical protein
MPLAAPLRGGRCCSVTERASGSCAPGRCRTVVVSLMNPAPLPTPIWWCCSFPTCGAGGNHRGPCGQSVGSLVCGSRCATQGGPDGSAGGQHGVSPCATLWPGPMRDGTLRVGVSKRRRCGATTPCHVASWIAANSASKAVHCLLGRGPVGSFERGEQICCRSFH